MPETPVSVDTKQQRTEIRQFLGYFKPHLPLLILDLAAALGIAAVDLTFPQITRFSLSTLLPEGRYSAFAVLMIAMALAFVLRAGLQYVVTYWGHLLGVRMEADMRSDLFNHIETLDFRFFDRTRTGHLMSRVLSDLFEIVELAHHGPEILFISIVTLVGSFIAMMTIRWQLALVLLLLVPLIIAITAWSRGRMSHSSIEVKKKTAIINGDLENAISGIRVAKAFANEDYEAEKFMRGNNQYREAKKGYYSAMGIFHSGLEFATSILNVVVIALGGYYVVRGQMTVTDMLTFTIYVNTFISPIRQIGTLAEQYANGMAGFHRFSELMAVEPEISDAADAVELPAVKGQITFDDVTFAYREDEPVLHNIDLDIEPGRKIALVGPSGGGKTSLSQLIPRFYEPDSGRISIDGYDIRSVTLSSLRRQIGMVQQDVFLFADSIAANIRYGRLDATDAEVIDAARRADIHDFILSLPDGYDTEVGERGARLSGGQKQRISIARVFLKNPAILILDEATSALDTETELRIQSALDELSTGRTSIVIAHRLSTIRSADEIIYIDDGEIKERGTHDDLLAADGAYAELHEAQYRLAG